MKIAKICYADKTSHFSIGQEVERVSAGALSDYVLTAYKCLLIHVDYDNNDDHDGDHDDHVDYDNNDDHDVGHHRLQDICQLGNDGRVQGGEERHGA